MIEQLSKTIIQLLRDMDAEADTIKDGFATGLNWYGAHAREDLTRPQTEPEWSKELARRLCIDGWQAQAEKRYPNGTRQKCDLVVEDENNALPVWIEIKGAWREYWLQKNGRAIYESYLFHPLVPGLVAKSHTAVNDIIKLSNLSADYASCVAFLLVGFERVNDSMDADIQHLEELVSLNAPDWSRNESSWDDVRRSGERVHVWMWWRSIK